MTDVPHPSKAIDIILAEEQQARVITETIITQPVSGQPPPPPESEAKKGGSFTSIRKTLQRDANEFELLVQLPMETVFWRIKNLDDTTVVYLSLDRENPLIRDGIDAPIEVQPEQTDVPPIVPQIIGRPVSVYAARAGTATSPIVEIIYTTSRDPRVIATVALGSAANLGTPSKSQLSGVVVDVSGRPVTVSGNIVLISGQGVSTSVSGNAVRVSGQAVDISGASVTVNILDTIRVGRLDGLVAGIDLATAPFLPLNNINPAGTDPKPLAVASFPFVAVEGADGNIDVGPVRGINLLSGFTVSYSGGGRGMSGLMSLTTAILAGFDGQNASGLYPASVTNDGRVSAGISGQAVGVFGYSYSLISGAGIFNVASGRAVLHSIAINQWVSGGQIEIRDASSGLGGTMVGTLLPNITTITAAGVAVLVPHSQLYNASMATGIVMSTSGGSLNATVLYRYP